MDTITLNNGTVMPKQTADRIFLRIEEAKRSSDGEAAVMELCKLVVGAGKEITNPAYNAILLSHQLIKEHGNAATKLDDISDADTYNVLASSISCDRGPWRFVHPYQPEPVPA